MKIKMKKKKKTRLRRRVHSRGRWPSGGVDSLDRAHSWSTRAEEGDHPWLVSHTYLVWHPYTHVSELLSSLWLHTCPQSSTPRYLEELPFLWPELGLSSWLSQWPTSGTFPRFDILEVPCQSLFQFLAASIAKLRSVQPLFWGTPLS